tara:strand:- start:82 stop:297 length:216 start_codon:yes stop_codon:yes gene_type:complete
MRAKHKLIYPDQTSVLFEILELKTNQVIFATYNEDKAKALFKNLENGSGFDGNTPKYFAQNGPPRVCEEYK